MKMGTYDTSGTPRHDPNFAQDPFAECWTLLKMHGYDNDPEESEECDGCPAQQYCLQYHKWHQIPLDVQMLFKDVIFQMNLK